jgi:hypothetical protein
VHIHTPLSAAKVTNLRDPMRHFIVIRYDGATLAGRDDFLRAEGETACYTEGPEMAPSPGGA